MAGTGADVAGTDGAQQTFDPIERLVDQAPWFAGLAAAKAAPFRRGLDGREVVFGLRTRAVPCLYFLAWTSNHQPNPCVPSLSSSSRSERQTTRACSKECQDPDVFSPQGPDSPCRLPYKRLAAADLHRLTRLTIG